MLSDSNIFQKFFLMVAFCLMAATGSSQKQKIATLEVKLTKPTFGLDIPVSINLDNVTHVTDSLLNLLEVKGGKSSAIPFQIENGNPRTLHWIIKTGTDAPGKYQFELVKGEAEKSTHVLATVDGGGLIIHKGDQNLLEYYFKTMYPPAGVDSSFRRSGFIHPLWAPHGQVLTRIQAPDHIHHYGIWNPWTHVEYEGDTIDFWNIGGKQGTVRFANFVSVEDGPVFSEFEALHEHVVFKKTGAEKVAMNELHDVRVYRPQDDQPFYVVDFNFTLNIADTSPVKLLEYRYAGFGWRTTEKWDKTNSMVLTSEGKTRKDADGSKARWCIVQGAIDDDYAGVVMMSFPTNYNHPEPLRIWPETINNNRGDMFANFSPTKNMDWLLKPRQDYHLKYRMLVYNGKVDKDKAESAWQYFAYPPKVTVNY